MILLRIVLALIYGLLHGEELVVTAYRGIWVNEAWPLADYLTAKGWGWGQGKVFGATFVLLACLCLPAAILGLFTRLAAVILLVCSVIAAAFAFGDENGQPELPLIYSVICLAVFLAGPGKLSLDALLTRKR